MYSIELNDNFFHLLFDQVYFINWIYFNAEINLNNVLSVTEPFYKTNVFPI